MPPAVVVDCDPGIDDALALLALAELDRRGAVRVACVTAVAGNGPVELCARNAAFVVARSALRGTPVLAGAHGGDPDAPARHGSDGLGGVVGEGASGAWAAGGALELARQVGQATATILALGPMTNLAAADLPAGTRVVAMGGSLAGPREFNLAHDPPAAARILDGRLGVTLVPIDITGRVEFAGQALGEIARAAVNPLVGALLTAARARHPGDGGCPVHDAVALLALVRPELVRVLRGRVSLTSAGRVALDPDPAGACGVVDDIDVGAAERLLGELWLASPP
ncbi:MAG: nucleoside hydrolase [Actinobacteria bacterium]|nr:nucleoside hydrolase [Actinomycetota bacterium]